jgi:hypothetical protein
MGRALVDYRHFIGTRQSAARASCRASSGRALAGRRAVAGTRDFARGRKRPRPQNDPAIAVDPNNPNRIVAAANDHVTCTWSCTIDRTPCSALGEGQSGTYYSNDGGATWCCASSDR